ncbi:MAG: RnfABCDGE type electron transport complex subunit B [Clostridia bacterium]
MVIDILKAVLTLGVLALVFGIALAVAGKFFFVKEDERIPKIVDALPGANCGACGFAGCSSYADAIVNKDAPCNLCSVGGDVVCEEVSGIMGVEAVKKERFRAIVMCQGAKDIAEDKFNYVGLSDCFTASTLGGGKKKCPNGCLGLGNCVRACKFDAISIVDGIAVVDYNKCTACGMCKAACPKHIIALVPFDSNYYVACCNEEKGAQTRKYCKKGCIGCGKCVKECPTGAITVTNFNATIDETLCIKCGKCQKICPTSAIVFEQKTPN